MQAKPNLPEGWTPPEAPNDVLDPRSVGSPALVAAMLETCKGTGRRQGRRLASGWAAGSGSVLSVMGEG